MALSERITVNGNLITIEDCDGTVVTHEIDCGCGGGGTPADPGTTPPPLAANLCGQANWYAYAMRYYLFTLQDYLSGQADTFLGRHAAIAQTAANLGLPVSPWVWFMNGFIGAFNPVALANKDHIKAIDPTTQENQDILVCIILDMLNQGGGIFTYEAMKTRMEAQGWYSWGEMIAAIPLETFLAHTYLLSQGQPPLSTVATVVFSDCEDCDDVPTPIECPETCEDVVCTMLRPTGQTNDFPVTGYASIQPFVSSSAAMWFGAEFNPLRIDMLENRCVSQIVIRPYTPCSAGGAKRSAHYRIEIDDTNVSDFQCAANGTYVYYACGESQGTGDVIIFNFDTPLYGRRINIVPLREQHNIVQVSIKHCSPA